MSSFDDGLDEDDDVLLPPPLALLTLLFIFRTFSAVEFLTFFFWLFLLIIYANLGRSFTVHHRAACRSREDGEGIGDHQIRV